MAQKSPLIHLITVFVINKARIGALFAETYKNEPCDAGLPTAVMPESCWIPDPIPAIFIFIKGTPTVATSEYITPPLPFTVDDESIIFLIETV